MSNEGITNTSCGCVFCDLGHIPNTEINGMKFHHFKTRGNILCERRNDPKISAANLIYGDLVHRHHLADRESDEPLRQKLLETIETLRENYPDAILVWESQHGGAEAKDTMPKTRKFYLGLVTRAGGEPDDLRGYISYGPTTDPGDEEGEIEIAGKDAAKIAACICKLLNGQ